VAGRLYAGTPWRAASRTVSGSRSPPRQKRVFALVTAMLLVLLGGVSVWAATDPGSYGRSRSGCVNVVVPSTTGGGILHGCGATARAMCARAFTHRDRIALLTRPQCRLAGYTARGGQAPP